MMWACIAASAGWAVALVVSLPVFFGTGPDHFNGGRGLGFAVLSWLGLLVVAAGVGSCAIEDRVCEMAEREETEP